MTHRVIQVPLSMLLAPDQPPSVTVLSLGARLRPKAGPAELAALTGLSRPTVLHGLARLKAQGPGHGGARVGVPAALLAEPRVGPRAKVLYGLLQATPGFRGRSGQFTYAALGAMTGLSRNTLKRALAELVGAGWVQIEQEHQFMPVEFTLGSPALLRSQAEAAAARIRLNRARWTGEAIMQEYLSLFIDSDEFTDNARPGFLVNPQTGERLELDRFYPPGAAFEFNGAQHYRKTGRFTQEEADSQHFRDLIKAGICLYRGIRLTIIHPEDLSLQGIAKKVGRSMPLRSLEGHDLLIDLLEEASLTYRAAVPAR